MAMVGLLSKRKRSWEKPTKDLQPENEKTSDAVNILNRVCDHAIFVILLLNTGSIPSGASIFANPLCRKKISKAGSCRTLRIT